MSELRAEVRDLIEVEVEVKVKDNIAGFTIPSTETSCVELN